VLIKHNNNKKIKNLLRMHARTHARTENVLNFHIEISRNVQKIWKNVWNKNCRI